MEGNTMRTAGRQLLQLAAVALAALAVLQPAHALDYPTRTVRLVVGFPPGGSADIVARLVAQALTERMGQTFIIDNKPGAGSNLGAETVARAEPERLHADGGERLQCDQSDAVQEAQLRSA